MVLPRNCAMSAAALALSGAPRKAAATAITTQRFSMLSSDQQFCQAVLIAFSVLDLLVPVETHRFDDAAVDHDDARFVLGIGVEMLMGAIGRDIHEIALAPFEALWLFGPGKI